ncbi:MAG: phosphotransferase [Pirellulales bacterium]
MNRVDEVCARPDFPWLGLNDAAGLEVFLRKRGWLGANERLLACEKPGEGNMNLTIRVRTNQRSFIVKQARPWVEKYDHIAAPWDRMQYECRFYERVASIPSVACGMPRLLAADLAAHAIVLEDLADARVLASLYAGDRLSQIELHQLGGYLRALHEATRGSADPLFANRAMRKLNHEHIYAFPLAENNGLDLDQIEPGLEAAAAGLRQDGEYRKLARETGERYLSDGTCLVHGDFFPGSWLRTAGGIRVIDAEFCFYGDPEFDLGCAVAHLALASQPRADAVTLLGAYVGAAGGGRVQEPLVARFAAVEVMRRLIGVAQLPLAADRVNRSELLDRSRRALIRQSWEKLWE